MGGRGSSAALRADAKARRCAASLANCRRAARHPLLTPARTSPLRRRSGVHMSGSRGCGRRLLRLGLPRVAACRVVAPHSVRVGHPGLPKFMSHGHLESRRPAPSGSPFCTGEGRAPTCSQLAHTTLACLHEVHSALVCL